MAKQALLRAALACALFSAAGGAQTDAPKLTRIDPPNWWAGMPGPMLLLRGEHLDGARFGVSDRSLKIERVKLSGNGRWAELWMSASPAAPKTVEISVTAHGRRTAVPFVFSARRGPKDGLAGFSSKDVLYLIMTDRFADGDVSNDGSAQEGSNPRGWHGGDLKGVAGHLNYLQHLGITAVWLTPVYQNHEAGSYHGYGSTDLYAVDEHFGSLQDLKALAGALHARGMKLVLDTVPNHVGPEHPWVEDPPEPDWFHGTKAEHRTIDFNFKTLTDPYAPWRDQRDVLEGWFAGILPDMNQSNAAVSKYLTQNAVWWIEETGADGLRIDTFPYVQRDFWHGFHAEIHGLYPRLTTVGEIFHADPAVVSAFAGGATRSGIDTGLDTPFDFPSYYALRDVFLHDAPLTKLAETLRLDALYPHPERLVTFLGNHDTKRFASEKDSTPEKQRLAFVVLLTMRGMPQIYAGDEIGMEGGDDPDNRRNFPGGFPDDTKSAFVAADRSAGQQEMYNWVRKLLAIRQSSAALQSGEQQLLYASDDSIVYLRGGGPASQREGGRILVIVNKSRKARELKINLADTVAADLRGITPLLQSEGAALSTLIDGSTLQVKIGAQSAVLASVK